MVNNRAALKVYSQHTNNS